RVRGDWTPSTSAPVLLTLQLVLLWQVGLRGLDYVRAGAHPALDASVADPLLGWLLYGAAILVLIGLAVRRAAPVILGQALLVGALGVDYRTSTGLLASGLVHGALAVGTFVLWQRDRLTRYLDDLDHEDAPCRTS